MGNVQLQVTLCCTLFLGFLTPFAAGENAPATQPALSRSAQLEVWWANLEKQEPESSRALLQFSTNPAETIAFFTSKMKPVAISQEQVKTLLTKLGGDDEIAAKAAYEELDYFDPRLAIDLETLMKEVTETPLRQRLVAVLSGRPMDAMEDHQVVLRPSGPKGSGDFNFYSKPASWWAEGKVSRINSHTWGTNKTKWTRAVRAITLLAYFQTPDALAIVKDMATGHPDAQPTRAAHDALMQH